MTAPRQILPGTTYLVTHRCSERRFFLRPSALTNSIFLYVLGVAARRYGVEVHAFSVLSDHFHLVVTDPRAALPAFAQYLDSLVARAVNATIGHWEGFWASTYSGVALQSPEDVVAKCAYVLANPVAAGLVRYAREWPGLWTAPSRIGAAPLVAERPTAFFRATSYMPARIELELTAPAGFASPEDFREQLTSALADAEERAVHAVSAARRGFLGGARILAQKPFARPATLEPRRCLNPRVAARDESKRIEALTRLAEFVVRYREAREAWRAGVRDALFPSGTYLLRVAHGASCAPFA